MKSQIPIPQLFISNFRVDYSAPFRRHLNRLEVEIGKEDYQHLKRVEWLDSPPPPQALDAMEELTERILKTTQNNYNRELLIHRGVRIFLDPSDYCVYYLLPEGSIRFVPHWRRQVLQRMFRSLPTQDTGWRDCGHCLAGFEARFLPDPAGGALLLRRLERDAGLPLLTATHGPYDPFTLDVAFYFLRSGKGDAAIVNLGFSGREPLADDNLELLKSWGVPLNPSNIDVIYPYTDATGHPWCYKMEEGFSHFAAHIGGEAPCLVIDLHGYVGTFSEDSRLLVGLGGFPPFARLAELGRSERVGHMVHLLPHALLRQGLSLLRDLSEEIYIQFCEDPHRGYNLFMLGGMQLMGRDIDSRIDLETLLPGAEVRNYLPKENLRWLPGAGANALQRREATKLNPDVCCLHVEIPTSVRRRIALKLRELEIIDSLESSTL